MKMKWKDVTLVLGMLALASCTSDNGSDLGSTSAPQNDGVNRYAHCNKALSVIQNLDVRNESVQQAAYREAATCSVLSEYASEDVNELTTKCEEIKRSGSGKLKFSYGYDFELGGGGESSKHLCSVDASGKSLLQTLYEKSCSSSMSSSEYARVIGHSHRYLDARMTDAWLQCVKEQTGGVIMYDTAAGNGSDEETVVVHVDYSVAAYGAIRFDLEWNFDNLEPVAGDPSSMLVPGRPASVTARRIDPRKPANIGLTLTDEAGIEARETYSFEPIPEQFTCEAIGTDQEVAVSKVTGKRMPEKDGYCARVQLVDTIKFSHNNNILPTNSVTNQEEQIPVLLRRIGNEVEMRFPRGFFSGANPNHGAFPQLIFHADEAFRPSYVQSVDALIVSGENASKLWFGKIRIERDVVGVDIRVQRENLPSGFSYPNGHKLGIPAGAVIRYKIQ